MKHHKSEIMIALLRECSVKTQIEICHPSLISVEQNEFSISCSITCTKGVLKWKLHLIIHLLDTRPRQ